MPFSQSHGSHCALIIPECKQIEYSSKTGQQNIIKERPKKKKERKKKEATDSWEKIKRASSLKAVGQKTLERDNSLSKRCNSVNKRLEEELLAGVRLVVVQKLTGCR